jgi:leucyl-tRNA synthetase
VELKSIDKWMLSKLQYRIHEITDALSKMETRRAVQNAFNQLMNDMKWYERRGGYASRKQIINTWVRLMAPFTPHLCDELWEEIGGDFISLSKFPEADTSLINKGAELTEEITSNTLRDIDEILRLIKIKPKKIFLYTAPSWKKEVLKKAILMKKETALDMKGLMNSLMSEPQMKPHAKHIPKFAQKVISDVRGMDDNFMNALLEVDLDEKSALQEALDFLKHEIGCGIEIYSADAPEYDPENKSGFASPMRPAIYIEKV